MAGWGEYNVSMKMRDLIERIAKTVVDRERPRYAYATVNTIDKVNRKATVTFSGESTPVTVTMGSVIPKSVGQIVRVGGIGSDRFIDDVMGDTAGGGAAVGDIRVTAKATLEDGWLKCEAQFVSQATYSALFAEVGHSFNGGVDPGDGTFRLPDTVGRDIVGAGTGFPLGSSGGADTLTLSTNELPAHTHTINHDHGAFSTASGGTHTHELRRSGAAGANQTTIPEGTALTYTGTDGMATNGQPTSAHTHSIDVPNYTGSSGSAGTGAPANIKNRYTAFNVWIKY